MKILFFIIFAVLFLLFIWAVVEISHLKGRNIILEGNYQKAKKVADVSREEALRYMQISLILNEIVDSNTHTKRKKENNKELLKLMEE